MTEFALARSWQLQPSSSVSCCLWLLGLVSKSCSTNRRGGCVSRQARRKIVRLVGNECMKDPVPGWWARHPVRLYLKLNAYQQLLILLPLSCGCAASHTIGLGIV